MLNMGYMVLDNEEEYTGSLKLWSIILSSWKNLNDFEYSHTSNVNL